MMLKLESATRFRFGCSDSCIEPLFVLNRFYVAFDYVSKCLRRAMETASDLQLAAVLRDAFLYALQAEVPLTDAGAAFWNLVGTDPLTFSSGASAAEAVRG